MKLAAQPFCLVFFAPALALLIAPLVPSSSLSGAEPSAVVSHAAKPMPRGRVARAAAL